MPPAALSNPEARMRIPAHNQLDLTILCCGVALASACASAGSPDLGPRTMGFATVITEQEIVDSRATNAYDVVARSHPLFLLSKVDLNPLMEREVWLNGVRLGGINELHLIPVNSIREIRFVRAIDNVASGVGHPGGAILVFSKVGR
jgi:hypothetical protein